MASCYFGNNLAFIFYSKERIFIMKERRTKEEIVAYEVKKIRESGSEVYSAAKFKSKAIDIQVKAWDENFANEKYEIACDVLMGVEHCSHINCDDCPLKVAHEEAISEILSGDRTKPERKRVKRFKYSIPGYLVTVKTNPETGVITSVMRPFVGKGDAHENN